MEKLSGMQKKSQISNYLRINITEKEKKQVCIVT